MHAAPPLSVVVTRSRQLAVLMYFLALLSWMLWFSWAWKSGFQQAPVLLQGILTLFTSGVFIAYWFLSPRGTLSWDGSHWDWRRQRPGVAPIRLTRVEVCLDWQWGQLLRMSCPGKVTWIWFDSAMASDRWQDFRRATAFEAGLPQQSRDQGMQL